MENSYQEISYKVLVNKLQDRYELREAHNIARLIFEDGLGLGAPPYAGQLSQDQLEQLYRYQRALLAGRPVQYVLGTAHFYGYEFRVNESVLIPRPETEELCHAVIERFMGLSLPNFRILDVGTGSGCIPIVLAKKLPEAEVWGIDVSADALAVASENADRLEVQVQFQRLDILNEDQWNELPDFRVLVSNPPYITREEASWIGSNVAGQEPDLALFVDDDDPLLFYRRMLDFAHQKLIHPGWIFFETNEFYGEKLRDYLVSSGVAKVNLQKDLSDRPRIVSGQLL